MSQTGSFPQVVGIGVKMKKNTTYLDQFKTTHLDHIFPISLDCNFWHIKKLLWAQATDLVCLVHEAPHLFQAELRHVPPQSWRRDRRDLQITWTRLNCWSRMRRHHHVDRLGWFLHQHAACMHMKIQHLSHSHMQCENKKLLRLNDWNWLDSCSNSAPWVPIFSPSDHW